MDISYLLFLQNLRESGAGFVSDFMLWMSKFAVGFWPIAMACMVYWVFDRRAGKKIFAGFGLGLLATGFLKLTFRITRPWLRDSRVLPYGDSKVSATGYSFPSGHSTFATGLFGGMAWWQRKRNLFLATVLFGAMILTMFSRNFLGVHTPQDVLVGMLSTVIMMAVSSKIEDWTDKNTKRDIFVIIGGLLLCVGLILYYQSINIAELYDEAGTLVINPKVMKADSFEGIGFVSAFAVCRMFERRFDFDIRLSKKDRFIISVFALIPLYWWFNNIMPICVPFSRALGRYLTHSGTVVYSMIIVPFVMSKIRLPKWMLEKETEVVKK
ncbi:MAG: phosphatase PAP2 family protein [Clostridia bacterium]|nr:phosphatase PAP2 family protein [Clostridia bacterium]